MAPKRPPKATPKFDEKWIQKGVHFWAALGLLLGSVLGLKTRPLGGHIFQVFRSFRVHFLERRLLRKPCFLQGKTKVLGFILGPKTDPCGDPFFQVFCHFQNSLRLEKCKQSCTGGSFCSPARGPKKLFFSRFSGLLFWLHVGSVLAPSWPHPGLSRPLLAHLGPSWPHLGSILAPSWPLLASLCALLAPSWH